MAKKKAKKAGGKPGKSKAAAKPAKKVTKVTKVKKASPASANTPAKVSAKAAAPRAKAAAPKKSSLMKVSTSRPGSDKAHTHPAETSGPKWAGVGDAAVLKATGKGWAEWIGMLDADGCAAMPHKQIAELVHSKHAVGDWWSQMVTVGYEQAKGLRDVHQQGSTFTANISKTVGVPVEKLYAAWTDAARDRWLTGCRCTVRTMNEPRSVRMNWDGPGEDGSRLDVNFTDKGGGRSMVAVEHNRLADAAAVQRARGFWSHKLELLRLMLEGGKLESAKT